MSSGAARLFTTNLASQARNQPTQFTKPTKPSKAYTPRQPERTLLHHTVAEHFETWFELAGAGQFDGPGDHHTPAPYAEMAFRKYLECGIFVHGFARVRCDDCRQCAAVHFLARGATKLAAPLPHCGTSQPTAGPGVGTAECDFHAATGLNESAIATVRANVRKRILRAFVARGHIAACDAKDMAERTASSSHWCGTTAMRRNHRSRGKVLRL